MLQGRNYLGERLLVVTVRIKTYHNLQPVNDDILLTVSLAVFMIVFDENLLTVSH